jgi:hypothetical protein
VVRCFLLSQGHQAHLPTFPAIIQATRRDRLDPTLIQTDNTGTLVHRADYSASINNRNQGSSVPADVRV